jgi:D-alanine--D-alanine ligase
MSIYDSVCVLMGGPSGEREVSLASGKAAVDGLREAGYQVTEVDVTGHIVEVPADTDVVFIALHGKYGEDGGVQAELSARGIPYTGSDEAASRLAFDKALSKQVMAEASIRTPDCQVLKAGDPLSMPLPVMIKPVREGSSLGAHRVLSDDQVEAALDDAFTYDDRVLAEAFIEGRELTVGIVGDSLLPVVEIVAPDNLYDYRAKYTSGASEYHVPASIEPECEKTCKSYALKLFDALGCRGFARVDMLLAESGDVYVLELNTIPGFTETSLLPKAAAAAGVSFADLCDRIVRMAAC